MAIFKGAGVAIVTPMREDRTVDFEQFTRLLEFQISNGTDAIIVCGTTGESSTLTHEEHLEVIRYCVETVAGRIPVIAGTGSNCTETAIYLSTEAEKMGVDGLLLVSPYYNKATQKGLYAHFKAVADAVKIPILLPSGWSPAAASWRTQSAGSAGSWRTRSPFPSGRGSSDTWG